MYIVYKGSYKREYDMIDSYNALLTFKRELGLTSLEGVTIRWFGGTDIPAETLWPRVRKSTPNPNKDDLG